MTVAEAIKLMKDGATPYFEDSADKFCEAYDMAIRSLEAWKKVLDELREYGSICVEYTAEDDKVDAVVDSVLKQAKQAVLEIINKHLMEVTQNE